MERNTTRLENWIQVGLTLVGRVYEDAYGRFEDGICITTSPLLPMSMQVSSPKEGVEVFTQNTVYLLGKKEQG